MHSCSRRTGPPACTPALATGRLRRRRPTTARARQQLTSRPKSGSIQPGDLKWQATVVRRSVRSAQMLPSTKEPVMAEVLLRHPDPRSADRVARFLREQGIEVSSIGAASLSIYSDQDRFEHVFQTSLESTTPSSPPQGIYDFG